jgi:hypothetical protein
MDIYLFTGEFGGMLIGSQSCLLFCLCLVEKEERINKRLFKRTTF